VEDQPENDPTSQTGVATVPNWHWTAMSGDRRIITGLNGKKKQQLVI